MRPGWRVWFLSFLFVTGVHGSPQQPPDPSGLKSLSLEELSQIEVTTPSKSPVKAFQPLLSFDSITRRTTTLPPAPALSAIVGKQARAFSVVARGADLLLRQRENEGL